jgi:hypothetical protein
MPTPVLEGRPISCDDARGVTWITWGRPPRFVDDEIEHTEAEEASDENEDDDDDKEDEDDEAWCFE